MNQPDVSTTQNSKGEKCGGFHGLGSVGQDATAESEGSTHGQPGKFEFPRPSLSKSPKPSWLGMNQTRRGNEKVL